MFQGKIENLRPNTLTHKMIEQPALSRNKSLIVSKREFGVKSANANNLKNVDVKFESNKITAIKGVSGSGKSSLIKEVLFRSWQRNKAIGCTDVFGLGQFSDVRFIDQETLKQGRLSTPVTFTGLLDQVKSIFSKTSDAKAAGLKKGDFSYLSKNGKCKTCSGLGRQKTSMDFMSDIWLTCDVCNGMRYDDTVLQIKYQGKCIGEVLNLTVTEAIEFFKEGEVVVSLQILEGVGLGHLILGQSGDTLSGGETQRLKLATTLLKKQTGETLFLLDEPSTGLHYFDVLNLISVLDSLIARGDSVIFIEHNATLIEAADVVFELGPGSGDQGGRIV